MVRSLGAPLVAAFFAVGFFSVSSPSQTTEAASAAEKTVPPIDFSRWARFIVRDFFDVQPYETFLLMADPDYYPELTDAVRAELLEARAVEVGTILFDGKRVEERRSRFRPRATDPEYKRRADAAWRRLFEGADVFLWLPYRHSLGYEEGDWRLWEHMVEGTGARGLHFHWIQNLDRFRPAEIATLSRMYERALDVDYAALSAHQDRIISALRGAELRVTTPAGTELRMRMAEDSWIHKGDGRMDRERASKALAVRDLEMELPAGALRFIPDVDSLEGTLAVPAWGGGEGVGFHFRDGRIGSITARRNEDAVLAAWSAETGDKDRLAEMVIGTNPRLPATGPGERPPYYGYGAGVLRIALGDNWESGGENRSSMEAWFWFTDATVAAGGTTIVEDGRLVLR